MREKKVFMIVLAGMLVIQGSAWAKGKDKKQDEEKSTEEVVQTLTPVSEGGTLNNNFPEIPDTQSMIQQARPPGVPGIRPVIPTQAAVPGVDPNVMRIQKEIRDVIKLNEELKNRYQSQALEIQRINEQAKIHQKILEDINKIPRKQVLEPQDTEELLKQEKLRVIERETEASREFVEGLKKGEKGEEAPAGEKSESAASQTSQTSQTSKTSKNSPIPPISQVPEA